MATDVRTEAATLPVTLHINGSTHDLDLDPRTTVLDALRQHLDLTGSKKGCDHGQCGSCTVLLDGRRVNSCLLLAVAHQDAAITTIEGIADAQTGELHPVQEAFLEHDGYQCGYCTPGQICSAVGMLDELKAGWPSSHTPPGAEPEVTEDEITERMSGNLCRCGAYVGIRDAVMQAGEQLR